MVGGADRVARRQGDTRFAGVMSGDLPGAQPVAADFRERPWSEIAAAIGDRLETPPSFQPPAGVTRMEAIAALEASGTKMAHALDVVTPERGAGLVHQQPNRRRPDQPLSSLRVGDRPRHPSQQAGEAGARTIGWSAATAHRHAHRAAGTKSARSVLHAKTAKS